MQFSSFFQGIKVFSIKLFWWCTLTKMRSQNILQNAVLWNRLNPFSTNVPLLYPLKTSENLWFSDVFRGYGSGTLVENGLNTINRVKIYFLKLPYKSYSLHQITYLERKQNFLNIYHLKNWSCLKYLIFWTKFSFSFGLNPPP